MSRSIRHGWFAALAGFTLLICVCYTGLALIVAYVTEDMLIDRLMAREAAAVEARARQGGGVVAGEGWIRAYRDPSALPPAVRAAAAAGRQRAEVFAGGGRHYHLRTLDLPGAGAGAPQRLYLVADAGPLLVVSAVVRDVGAVLAAVALGLTGLALLLAWWLSRRLVAPLLALADAVRGLKPGEAVAFDASRRRDEIGYLAERLGTALSELHAALAREHAFTRDAGHELRTPLTVMRNTLAGAQPDVHAVAQLRTQVDAMAATVDVLFALARAEHVAAETFDLRAPIEDTLLKLLDAQAFDAGRLALDLPDRLPVSGNRYLALLLIENCLGNALFHGGPGTRLALSFADGVLAIANSVDPARRRETQGFLHGQNLLRRAAAAMDWDLRFEAGTASYRVELVPLRPR
ncbi:HAMP domain-containing sensor histidine kinase [Herbaspirillum sp. SJZ107]|uniref:sensor histidine kinase n=1 Tax=Herbaspirillum sp. SJZ107 TaxID=2572881 RepID=UPI00114FD647|nr:HAMP domain-containing protein [Herbaspirillum sp. SJZ107]TQK11131.1 signal transduction histidine kinase [Herbaspirillum sp. SJZ107]